MARSSRRCSDARTSAHSSGNGVDGTTGADTSGARRNRPTAGVTGLTPSEASKQLVRAHICTCETCAKAFDVTTADDFCVVNLCDDGRALLGAAHRLYEPPAKPVSA